MMCKQMCCLVAAGMLCLASALAAIGIADADPVVGQGMAVNDQATPGPLPSSRQPVAHGRPDPGVWVRGLVSAGKAYSASINGHAILLGGGDEVRPGLILGVAIGSIGSRISTDQFRVNTHANGLYLYSMFHDGPLFINAAVAGGYLKMDSARYLQPSGSIAAGDASGRYTGLAFKAGYRLTHGKLFLAPYVGAGYLHIHRNAYAETGAGLLDRSYAAANHGIGSFRAGARIGADLKQASGLVLSPWVEVGGIVFAGAGRKLILKVPLNTVQQVIPSMNASSSAGTVDAGLAVMGTSWSADFVYLGQFSRHAYLNTGDLKLVYRW